MLLNNIKTGDRLEITCIDNLKRPESYISQVEHVVDKNKVLIHMPIASGKLIKLDKGKKYSFLFFTDNGMVRYEAIIVEHSIEDGFRLTLINIVSKGVKVQRREFFRFTCLIPTKFSVQEKNDSDDTNKIITFEGIIKDIGGGGVRFVTNKILREDDKIRANISLNNDVLITMGRILEKQSFPKSSYKYQYRVEFIGMQKNEQEAIVQYIFEQQRKILQKTKI